MEFLTRIPWQKPLFEFSYEDKITMMGSCFVENIGKIMEENKFTVDINPFGTLYNPSSVANGLRMLLRPEPFTVKDLFQQGGVYHSFSHHSRFSSTSEEECLDRINSRLSSSADFLQKATRLIITWGTASIYRLKSNGTVVANCHKLPERLFQWERLSVDDIVNDWRALLLSLWEQNQEMKILLTVSPIRHWKDGAHENQLSKATLLLAAEALQEAYPERIDYFPSYELLMDELRDYRFYADDMLHPSPLAIDYIWQRFIDHFLSRESTILLKEWGSIRKAIDHKPFQPDSKAYRQFILQTLLKMKRIREKMPSFDLLKEMVSLMSKLEQEDGVLDSRNSKDYRGRSKTVD